MGYVETIRLALQLYPPEMEIMAKYHHGLIFMKGMGAQVKKTVTSRKNLRPQMSERAPTRGAERKERKPLMPTISPFIRNVWSGKVWKRKDDELWVFPDIYFRN